MTELCIYQITNIELKNNLIIVVLYGNLTDVRKEKKKKKIKISWNIDSSRIDRRCDFNSTYK